MGVETNYFAHPSAVIDEDCTIGPGTKIWHFSHIMPGCAIGKNCHIGQNVVVMPGVIIGDFVKIQNNVSLYSGVICEDFVFLGPSCVFTNVINPRSEISRRSEFQKTLVCRGATIGANATLTCGIKIGSYAFVGAGAVVTKDILAFALVIGNPASQMGWMSESGQKLMFDSNSVATCSQTGQIYKLDQGIVKKI